MSTCISSWHQLLERGMHTFKARMFIAQAFTEWHTQSPICSSTRDLEQGIHTSPSSFVGAGSEVYTFACRQRFLTLTHFPSFVCQHRLLEQGIYAFQFNRA